MSSAKITLVGMNNYLLRAGDDLFKEMSLPEGVDIETLKDVIILQGAEFEVLYADPIFFQAAIGSWAKKWYRTIDKWVKALAVEYSPLENYDRIEEWSDTNHGEDTSTGQGQNETLNRVSAFNSSSLENDSGSASSLSNTNRSSTDTNGVHRGRIRGNIGTLTSQSMLQSELDIAYWNLYEKISALFLAEFVIPVY